jgi:hypothetical protein
MVFLQRTHIGQKLGVRSGLGEFVDQQFHGFYWRQRIQDFAQDPDSGQIFLWNDQLFFPCTRALNVDGREDTFVGKLAIENYLAVAGAFEFFKDPSQLPVPLNSSKITSSMREPVSISAVAMMVSEPPSSMLRAAPKKRLGRCKAFESTPPESTLPEGGTMVL